jgi:hypothetical protein
MDRRIRPHEDSQLLVNGAFPPPINKGVENQLAAAFSKLVSIDLVDTIAHEYHMNTFAIG